MSSAPLLDKQEAPEDWEQHCTVLDLCSKPSRRRSLYEGAFWLGTPLVLGVVVGLVLAPSDFLPPPVDRVSSVIGWVYFCAWSISFYPQAYLNYRRKSVVGLSLDFQLLNLLGFGCYAVYNAALFWNPVVRHEYSCMHFGSKPAVHANDVFFALHAAVVTSFTLVQCAIYERGGQRVSWFAALGTGGALAAIAAYLAAVVAAGAYSQGGGGGALAALRASAPPTDGPLPCGDVLSWLSFLYFLSYIKLGVSLVKYIPQVYLNYKRQSTEGWNVHNVLLDFGGGLLSLAQLLLDGAVSHDWTAVTGNPVKFALGFTSMFFDVIFMAQHWLLYPAAAAAVAWVVKQQLLPGQADPAAGSVQAAAAAADDALEAGGSGGDVPQVATDGDGAEIEAADEQPLLRAQQ